MSSELSTYKAARKHHFLVFFTKLVHSPTSGCLVPAERGERTTQTVVGSNERLVHGTVCCRGAVGHYTLGSETSGGDLRICVWFHSSGNDTLHICACWLEAFHEWCWRDECKPCVGFGTTAAPVYRLRSEFRMLPFSFLHLSEFKINTCLCKHV